MMVLGLKKKKGILAVRYAFRFPVDTNVKVTLGVEVEALFLAIEIASTKPSIELDSVLIEDIY